MFCRIASIGYPFFTFYDGINSYVTLTRNNRRVYIFYSNSNRTVWTFLKMHRYIFCKTRLIKCLSRSPTDKNSTPCVNNLNAKHYFYWRDSLVIFRILIRTNKCANKRNDIQKCINSTCMYCNSNSSWTSKYLDTKK